MPIADILERVNSNKSGLYDRLPELVAKLPKPIADVVGDDEVYVSEFIIAKIKGKINGMAGHTAKITDSVLLRIPGALTNPYEIIEDMRNVSRTKYLFIEIDDVARQIVVELKRRESSLTEINTIFDTTMEELKRLEGKLLVVYSSGDTPVSRMRASQNESAGRGFSGPQK